MDIHFWEKVQRKLTNFFVKHLLPELITQAMKQEKVYCLCEGRCKDNQMITCDNASCQYEWFHFKCVGIKHAPEGTWFCPLCSSGDTV